MSTRTADIERWVGEMLRKQEEQRDHEKQRKECLQSKREMGIRIRNLLRPEAQGSRDYFVEFIVGGRSWKIPPSGDLIKGDSKVEFLT